MNIALFGASGTISRRIAQEALARGHMVTAIVHDPARLDVTHERLTVAAGDVRDPANVAHVAARHDVVVSAIGPARGEQAQNLVDKVNNALVLGAPRDHATTAYAHHAD